MLEGLSDYKTLMSRFSAIKKTYSKNTDLIEVKIAILAGSTVGILKDFLETFLLLYNIRSVFWEGSYNRVFEESVFENEELDRFHPDFVYIHMSNRNLDFHSQRSFNGPEAVDEYFDKLKTIWDSLKKKYNCSIIQNTFEYYPYRVIGNSARYNGNGLLFCVDRLNSKIAEYSGCHEHILLNDLNYLSSYYGLSGWYNDNFWYLYKYPFDMKVMPAIAANIAALIKAVSGKNKKSLILDLDNTLWKGEIGEIGTDRIEMTSETAGGEQFQLFQKYLLMLQKHGILLNICSKNDHEEAIKGLRTPGTTLLESDFTIKKINWEEKYKNIIEILSELNLGNDSSVFIDDNAIELDSASEFVKGLETIEADNVSSVIARLENEHFFEMVRSNREDLERAKYYEDNRQRTIEQSRFTDYGEYLRSLNMSCIISPITESNMDRALQLINKTNQFNLNASRLARPEIYDIMTDNDTITLTGRLIDKFGDNGIVTILIAKLIDDTAYIDTWVMSCRVFKRDLEYAIWAVLLKETKKRGMKKIVGMYKSTEKNQKYASFYTSLGLKNSTVADGRIEFSANLEDIDVVHDFYIELC